MEGQEMQLGMATNIHPHNLTEVISALHIDWKDSRSEQQLI